jgi:anaerobic magnesium-protoporphyrin IX monomethyl ester cyclase
MNVLFTHSYFLRFDAKEYKAHMPYPPLGTLYAAAYARSRGYAVSLADSMLAEGPQHILPFVRDLRPKVLVIYDDDFNYLTKMCLTKMREAAFAMSTLGAQAGCTVVVHGSDATDHLAAYFQHGAHYVLCGEAEETLVELLDALLHERGSIKDIRGLAYIEEGSIRQTEPRKPQKDLDRLPFPAWDLVDIQAYRRVWRKHHGYFSLNMVTTRGCPYHCNWCAKPIYGQVYNSRTPANVVEEMLWLKHHLKPDHLWFCDDIFGLKPGWVQSFSEEVLQRDAVIPFKCLARVDLLLHGDTIAALRRAGCRTVWVGAESGSQKILDAMEKGTTVAQIYEATRKLKEAGIRVGFFLQYGYPGETRDDIERTLTMLHDCLPDEIGVSVSYPLPGTKFYERVKAQLGQKTNWIDSADLDTLYPSPYSPDFYRALHKLTHKKLRVWQTTELVKKYLVAPWRTDYHILRRLAAGAYHYVTAPSLERRLNSLAHSP